MEESRERRQFCAFQTTRSGPAAMTAESVLTYEGTVEMHTLMIGRALTGQTAYR